MQVIEAGDVPAPMLDEPLGRVRPCHRDEGR